MNMEENIITGNQVLELIRDKRRVFHDKAQFPNAILIHPSYYSLLKEVIPSENLKKNKKILDLEIFITEDVPSIQLIRIYDTHECSI